MGPERADGSGVGWADALRERLFEQRTVLVRGELTDVLASETGAALMTLDALGDSRITVQLDVTGGGLDAAFSVMDVIDLLGVPVEVRCVGRAEGPGVGILAVGSHRVVAPHARIRLVDPSASAAAGPASSVRGRPSTGPTSTPSTAAWPTPCAARSPRSPTTAPGAAT